jgi:nucleoside-diphosphate-sugar epimerase
MRVLVTGANGFLGGEIARRFAARGDVELFATSRDRLPSEGRIGLDLAQAENIVRILTVVKPDVIVHAAGRSEGSRNDLERDNVIATRNLAESMQVAAPRAALVLLSSAAQYGEARSDRRWREADTMTPATPYAQSKLDAESAAFSVADAAGLRVATLRLFNVVAARAVGSQVLATFLRRAADAASEGPAPWGVRMGPLGAVRDFVAVSDVVRAVEAVIDRGAWGEAINVCTGVGRPARALIAATASAFDGALIVEEAEGDVGVASSIGDPSLCEAWLGFRPSADLATLTRDAAAWIREAAGARSEA